MIELYRHANEEVKQVVLIKNLKPDVSIENVPLPLYIDMFNEDSQCVPSLLYQVLGMDSDRFVPKFLLSLLFRLSLH